MAGRREVNVDRPEHSWMAVYRKENLRLMLQRESSSDSAW